MPALPVLFEDDDFIVVDKPIGIASIPERDPKRPNVQANLTQQLGKRLFVVHRLDKEVSGVLVFAKNAASHKLLNEQFSQRHVQKEYVALVHGAISPAKGTIDAPIRQFGSGRMGVDWKKGKPSTTRYCVAQVVDGYSLLDIELITGRRHQIRVHLYSVGHPIVGDLRYGEKSVQSQYERLMLHAKRLTYSDASGKEHVAHAQIPASFEALLTQKGLATKQAMSPRK